MADHETQDNTMRNVNSLAGFVAVAQAQGQATAGRYKRNRL